MNLRKVLKYAGKTAATIVCPPVGLALWPKKSGNKVLAALGGVALSFASTVFQITRTDIYDNPKVISSGNYPKSTTTGIVSCLSSPLLHYLTSFNITTLDKDGEVEYSIRGDDVVTFENGEYKLNLSPDKEFFVGNFPFIGYPYKSLAKSQEKVRGYEQKLEQALSQGDVFTARDLRGKLDNAVLELKKTGSNYEMIRQEFQKAVDRANSELETLAAGIHNKKNQTQGEQK